jgi:serine phosphatase RsbU (regulator of sigma subunit)
MKNIIFEVLLVFFIGQAFGQNDSIQKSLLTKNLDLANTLFYSNPDSAIIYARKAYYIANELNDFTRRAKAYITIGILQYSKNQFDSALLYYKMTEEILSQKMDSSILIALEANKSNIYMETKHYDKAIAALLNVKDYYENKGDTLNTGRVYGSLANIYLVKNKNVEAIEHYKMALANFEPIGDKVGVALCAQNLGIIYRDMAIYDTSLTYLRKARTMFESQGMGSPLAEVNGNIAAVMYDKGIIDSALYYNGESIEYFEKNDVPKELLVSYVARSMYLEDKGNDLQSLHLLKKAEKIADENNLIEFKPDVYYGLYDLFKKRGVLHKSLEYIEKYAEITDSLNKRKLQSREDELLVEYKVAQKEKDLEILKIKDKLNSEIIGKQHNVLILIGFVALLGLFLAYTLYNRYKVKNRANKLLEEKNEEIKSQSEEITSQNEILQQQKEDLTSSIDYARFIQQTILTPEIEDQLQIFTFNQPKDIVSGDFFWYRHTDNYHYVAVADCTGHGVPGAFMSLLSFTFLNEIFNNNFEIEVNDMLEKLRARIKKALHQSGKKDASRDGLDIALIRLSKNERKIEFSGAYRPCWIYDQNGFSELKANKQPIGIHPNEVPFSKQIYEPAEKAKVYLFTDGLTDQIDQHGKKYKISGLKDLLNDINRSDLQAQYHAIMDKFKALTSGSIQIDDVLIAGINY